MQVILEQIMTLERYRLHVMCVNFGKNIFVFTGRFILTWYTFASSKVLLLYCIQLVQKILAKNNMKLRRQKKINYRNTSNIVYNKNVFI